MKKAFHFALLVSLLAGPFGLANDIHDTRLLSQRAIGRTQLAFV